MANDKAEVKGNCHCGQFRFTVQLAEDWKEKGMYACNCSVCSKKGYLWIFPASSSHMTVEQGDGTLKEYEFGKKTMQHLFCPKCGTAVNAFKPGQPDGRALAVNARAFKGVDLWALDVHKFDGASMDPPYQPPTEYPALNAEVGEGEKLHNGSCHCGAVTYTVKLKPIEEVMSCNCSWCARNGELWVYPSPNDVVLGGKESLTQYEFARKKVTHLFCGTCGISVTVVAKDNFLPIQPINVRTMNGVELDKLKVTKGDGWSTMEPQYEI